MTRPARDRAVGTLVGLAVGDAVGTTLEFQPPGTFAPISDMVGGGPFRLPVGAWTDDTSMAMCLAESILDTGDLDPADQLRRYVAWWRDGYWSSNGRCFDIGGTTSAALSRFERTGAITDSRVDDESAANGSLMRLAAVPIRWHGDVAEAAERSGESSRTTHAARRPVDACRVMGAMIAALIQGTDADHVLGRDFWQWGDLDPAVLAIAGGIVAGQGVARDPRHRLQRRRTRSGAVGPRGSRRLPQRRPPSRQSRRRRRHHRSDRRAARRCPLGPLWHSGRLARQDRAKRTDHRNRRTVVRRRHLCAGRGTVAPRRDRPRVVGRAGCRARR